MTNDNKPSKFLAGLLLEEAAREVLDTSQSDDFLRKEWEAVQEDDSLPAFDPTHAWEQDRHTLTRATRVRRLYWLKIAATILLPVLLGIGSWRVYEKFSDRPSGDMAFVTGSNERSRFELSDGTLVWLNAESVLAYEGSYGKRSRQVRLEGEAYFEVSKAVTPFIVHAGAIDLQVLGTTFNVNAYPGNTHIEATLIEGSLVFREKSLEADNERVLIPGQKASYSKETGSTSIQEVNTDHYIAWKDGKLSFDNQYLEKIIPHLYRKYQIPIELDPALEGRFRFTLTIKDESLEEVLLLLQLTSPIVFEKQARGFIIHQKP